MADEVIRQTMANHAKPDGSVNSFAPTTGQHFLAARQAGIGAASLYKLYTTRETSRGLR